MRSASQWSASLYSSVPNSVPNKVWHVMDPPWIHSQAVSMWRDVDQHSGQNHNALLHTYLNLSYLFPGVAGWSEIEVKTDWITWFDV